MIELDGKIEKYRSELEEQYLRLRSGEDCMARVLTLSKRLDTLLLDYSQSAEPRSRGISNPASRR